MRTVEEIREYCYNQIDGKPKEPDMLGAHIAGKDSAYGLVIYFIDSAPVEPAKGDDVCEWVYTKGRDDYLPYYEINCVPTTLTSDGEETECFQFCPYCGRKILRKEESK